MSGLKAVIDWLRSPQGQFVACKLAEAAWVLIDSDEPSDK